MRPFSPIAVGFDLIYNFNMKRPLAVAKNFYARYERSISSLSLIGGFVFDAITLRRIDTLWENFWVLAHIIVVAVFIILVNITTNKGGDESNPDRAHFWFVNILQFFFGGLLSTYLVFYFRSADMLVSWPFILILVLAELYLLKEYMPICSLTAE